METRDPETKAEPRRLSRLRLVVLLLIATIAGSGFLIHALLFRNQRYQPVDLKVLGNFGFDDSGTINDVPQHLRALDGKRVRFEGFMWAPNASGPNVSTFQLVYSITSNHRPPRVNERVFAHVKTGAVPYDGDMTRVDGTLHVNISRDVDGKVVSVFTMDVDDANALPPMPTPPTVWPGIAALTASVVPLLFLVIWHFRNSRRSHRRAMGLCMNCGYDLRASPGRCPECGSYALSRFDPWIA